MLNRFRGTTEAESDSFRLSSLAENAFIEPLAEHGVDIKLSFNRHTIFPRYREHVGYYLPYNLERFFLLHNQAINAELLSLVDVSLFRVLPIAVKKSIYSPEGRLLEPMLAATPELIAQLMYLDYYIDEMYVASSSPNYHFIYLLGAHPPYVVPEGQVEKDAAGPVPYYDQAREVFSEIIRVMLRMKELGVYQNAGIVIHSDHGISFGESFDGTQDLDRNIERAATLLLVKEPGASGALKVSQAPTTLLDIRPTIMAWAGLEEATSTSPVSQLLTSNRVRENVPDHYKYTNNVMSVYRVEGSVFARDAWTKTQEVVVTDANH